MKNLGQRKTGLADPFLLEPILKSVKVTGISVPPPAASRSGRSFCYGCAWEDRLANRHESETSPHKIIAGYSPRSPAQSTRRQTFHTPCRALPADTSGSHGAD